MVIDHLKYLDLTSPLAIPCELLGRFAFPLFAVLVGWNISHYSRSPSRFSIRLLLAALIMEAAQYLCISPITGPEDLNVFFTLGLGALLTTTILNLRSQWASPKNLFLFALTVTTYLLIGPSCQYGLPGILLVVIVALPKPPSVRKLLPSALTIAALPNPLYGFVAASATWAGLSILENPRIKPCPLPNSKWLYLALPASFLPAWIFHHIFP